MPPFETRRFSVPIIRSLTVPRFPGDLDLTAALMVTPGCTPVAVSLGTVPPDWMPSVLSIIVRRSPTVVVPVMPSVFAGIVRSPFRPLNIMVSPEGNRGVPPASVTLTNSEAAVAGPGPAVES